MQALNGSNETYLPLNITSNHAYDESQQISWQSAFWALAALAINTCLQESGTTLDFDAELAVALKSSPFVCILDSLAVWLQLVYYIRQHGPKKAAQTVAGGRKLYDEDRTERRATLHGLVVTCLLALLAITQAVKLFVLRGVPWIQVLGAAFVVNYVTNAGLSYFGKPVPDSSPLGSAAFNRADHWPSLTYMKALALLAAFLQSALWLYIIERMWRLSMDDDADAGVFIGLFLVSWVPLQLYTDLVFLLAFAVMVAGFALAVILTAALAFGFLYVIKNIFKGPFRTFANCLGSTEEVLSTLIIVTITIGGACVEYYYVGTRYLSAIWNPAFAYWLSIFSEGPRKSHWISAICTILGAYAIYAFIVYIVISLLLKKRTTRRAVMWDGSANTTDNRVYWFVIFANAIIAVLYFRCLYSPEGTVKPPWTDSLG